jgi:hypothetical protein
MGLVHGLKQKRLGGEIRDGARAQTRGAKKRVELTVQSSDPFGSPRTTQPGATGGR